MIFLIRRRRSDQAPISYCCMCERPLVACKSVLKIVPTRFMTKTIVYKVVTGIFGDLHTIAVPLVVRSYLPNALRAYKQNSVAIATTLCMRVSSNQRCLADCQHGLIAPLKIISRSADRTS
jgi:hypothetical protein